MTQPLFSIVCTVKNRATLIRKCVESVLAQDDPAVELVVQDGASTDGTLEILREYGDRIRLESEPDRSSGEGLYRALARARGEYWGSCLSDEQLVPDAVSWARRTFAEQPSMGAIYGYSEGVDRNGTRLSRQDFGEFSVEDLLTYRQVPSFVASFFRMSCYRSLDLQNYGDGGEHDLWLRFAVRFPIRRFEKLVACYGLDRSTLSSQPAIYLQERAHRLETLRQLFRDDPAGRRYQYLEHRAYAGYFLRYAGMFVRNGEWALARESFREASVHRPDCQAAWLNDAPARLDDLSGAIKEGLLGEHLRMRSPASCVAALPFSNVEDDRLQLDWLHYTVDRPFNVWTVLPALGINRVAVFGGEGWGLAIHRQLQAAGVVTVAIIENNASVREAAMIQAPYVSLFEYLASGVEADAVLSSMQGNHDRGVLHALQRSLGRGAPVISWKMLLSVLSGLPDVQPVKASTIGRGAGQQLPLL